MYVDFSLVCGYITILFNTKLFILLISDSYGQQSLQKQKAEDDPHNLLLSSDDEQSSEGGTRMDYPDLVPELSFKYPHFFYKKI